MNNIITVWYVTVLFIGSTSLNAMEFANSSLQEQENKPFQFDDVSFDEDQQLVNKAYLMAHKEVHDLVHALKSNLPSQAYYGPLLFTGIPGTGKTTLGRIIGTILNMPLKKILAIEGYKKKSIKKKCKLFAHTNTPLHEYKYVNASEIGNHYQHSKAQDLKKLLRDILETQKHCVVVIDEVHALFSGQKNENSTQAEETALALKHMFEELENSNKVLLIFTTNYPEQIPQEYGLRSWFLQGNVFHFDKPDRKKQKLALYHHLHKTSDLKLKLPKGKLNELLHKLDGWSFRRIAALCDKAVQYALIKNRKKPVLRITHLKQSLRTLKKQYKLLEIGKKDPSEQERFCNESLALEKKTYNSQLKLAKKSMKFNRNLDDLQKIMQMRSLNIARYNASNMTMISTDNRNWGPNTNNASSRDLRKYGDSKKALPENLQSRIVN